MTLDPRAQELLNFWFEEIDRKAWFEKNQAFDDTLRARFAALREEAEAGLLDAWSQTPQGALALILLLDQLPRNLFRDDAKAYATDAKALEVSRSAIAKGFDQQLTESMDDTAAAVFVYLPLEHSEDLKDQEDCVALMAALGGDWVKWAEAHRVIIERFGRFPHRNAVLGRVNTAEEEAFLSEPGSSF